MTARLTAPRPQHRSARAETDGGMTMNELGPCSCGLNESDADNRHADGCSHWVLETLAEWIHAAGFPHDFTYDLPTPSILRLPIAKLIVKHDGWPTLAEALAYLDEEVKEWQ